MIPYYLVFLLLSIPVFVYNDSSSKKVGMGFSFLILFLIIFTGLRHHVGGDWNNYMHMLYTIIPHLTYSSSMNHDDPGFWLLFYFCYDIGWGLYGVNLIGAIIFMTGLSRLIKRESNPWLGLAVAFPYFIIVVSMGYTRQAIAIGFIMWAITYLRDDKFYKFIIAIFLAVTFHKTAIIMIGIGIFAKGKGRFFKTVAVLFIGIGMWNSFMGEAQADLWKNYVSSGDYQSSGALIRVFMNLIPALLLLYFRKEWKEKFDDYGFWYIIALGSIISLFLVQFASTAVDRIALYFIPIQVIVFSRIVILLQYKMRAKMIKLLVLTYYFSVLNVWLWFGVFSKWWLPYKNVIFVGLF